MHRYKTKPTFFATKLGVVAANAMFVGAMALFAFVTYYLNDKAGTWLFGYIPIIIGGIIMLSPVIVAVLVLYKLGTNNADGGPIGTETQRGVFDDTRS